MDGENNGKPYFLMGWFGGKTHYFRKHPFIFQWACFIFRGIFGPSSKNFSPLVEQHPIRTGEDRKTMELVVFPPPKKEPPIGFQLEIMIYI